MLIFIKIKLLWGDNMGDKTQLGSIFKIMTIPLLIILIAVVCGSINAGLTTDAEKEALSGSLVSFFQEVPKGDKVLFLNSLKKHLLVWSFITVSAAFMPAFVINAATLWERGYVIGYTAASFCRIYGIKGIMAEIALLPEMLIFIPILVFFSSISLKMSFLSHDNKKYFLKKYIFFVIICLSVFCVVSVFQTFVTTIFMSGIAKAL